MERKRVCESSAGSYNPSSGSSDPSSGSPPAGSRKRLKLNSNCAQVKDGIKLIAAAVGVKQERVHFPKSFVDLEPTSRKKRVNIACHVTDAIMSAFAPDAPNQMKQLVCDRRAGKSWHRDHSESFISAVQNIAEQYMSCSDRQTRMEVLATVAPVLRYLELEKYIPGLTPYAWKEARRYAKIVKSGRQIPPPSAIKERYKKKAVSLFIAFITSPYVVSDMPFGSKTVWTSGGTKEEIPNLLRHTVNTRIIKQYQEFLRVTHPGPQPGTVDPEFQLSESSMWKILDYCKASTRRSMMGLDYITYDGKNYITMLF